MLTRKMFIKNKIISYLTQKGKKTKSEKILNKSIKELQKNSKKPTKKLIQLSIVLSSIFFKIRIIKKKKKSIIKPIFISNKKKRFSFAIKLIVKTAKENSTNCLHNKLKEEFFSMTQLKSSLIKTKKNLKKQALNNKHLFKYYRWN
jgi:ribosomal protein S7